MAMKTLTRLQRFRNLSEKNKRKLYLTIVRPQLLYPIIPLASISKTAHKKLQKVQNNALRFIENTTLNDRIPSRPYMLEINYQQSTPIYTDEQ